MPQTYISGVGRSTLIASTAAITQQLNTLHWTVPVGDPTEDDCTAVNTMLAGWWESDYKSIVSQSVTLLAIHSRGMNARVAATNTLPIATAGLLTADALPYYVSYYVGFKTGITAPWARGGIHLFTADENANQPNGVPNSTYADNALEVVQNLQALFMASPYTLVIASFTHQLVSIITNLESFRKWGSVNSRKYGHGR